MLILVILTRLANAIGKSSTETQLRASVIARRRTEEERAEAFYPLGATTTAADPKRDVRAAPKHSVEAWERLTFSLDGPPKSGV
jgi:hypothetical protein